MKLIRHSITATAGQPSLFSEDWVIDQACEEGNKYSLPRNLRYDLIIQRFLRRVSVTMARYAQPSDSRRRDREGDGLMRLFECEFEEIKQQFGAQVTSLSSSKHLYVPLHLTSDVDIHRIALTMARLQLRTYYLLELSLPQSRKEGIIKACTTALTLISEIFEADTTSDYMIYAPSFVYLMLVTASMLVMKIVHSTYDRYIDCEGGKRAFNTVLGLLRRSVLEDNDTSGRATKILAQLWTIHREHRKEPSLNVTSRLGASILHDGLWTWREKFGGQGSRKEATSTNAPSQAAPAPTPLQTAPANTSSDNEVDLTGITTELEQQYNQLFPASRNNFYMNGLVGDMSNLD